MTWHPGSVATEPAGVAKTGVAVVCDGCRLATEFFSDAVVKRSGAEGVQRLLNRRGWTTDVSDGWDSCPACVGHRVTVTPIGPHFEVECSCGIRPRRTASKSAANLAGRTHLREQAAEVSHA